MKKPLKITLWAIAAVIVLVIIAFIVLINVINPNQFKPQIEKLVYQQTGRVLKIPGNLSWHFFPNVGISTGAMTLSNPPGYDQKAFLSIKSASVSVAVWPLLSHHVDIKNLSLSDLQLHLVQKSPTDNNWTFSKVETTTVEPPKPASDDNATETVVVRKQVGKQVVITREQKPVKGDSEKKSTKSEPYSFNIRNVSIQNATVYFDNLLTKQHYELQKFNLQTQNIESGKPFHVRASFAVTGNQPPLNLDVALTANLNLNMQQQRYIFHDLNLHTALVLGDTQTAITKLNGHLTGNADIDLKQGTVAMTPKMVLNNLVDITGQLKINDLKQNMQYTGDLQIQPFNLNRFMLSMGKAAPKIPNPAALENVSGKVVFSGDNNDFSAQSIHGTVGKTTLNGTLAIQNFQAPAIATTLSVNQFEAADFANLNGALLPMQGIQFNANVHMQGTGKKYLPSTLNGTINAKIAQMTLKGIDIGAMLSKLDEALGSVGHGGNALQIIGQLQNMVPKGRIDPNNGQATQFGQFTLLVNLQNGVAQAQKIDLNGSNMVVNGSGDVNLNQQTLNLNFAAFNPQVQTGPQGQTLPTIKIPLYVKGTFKKPQYGIEWSSLQSQIANYLAKSLIQQGLQDLLGGNKQQQPQQQENQSESQGVGKLLQGIFGK